MQMFEDKRSKFPIIMILILILVSMFIYYGSLEPEPSKGNYPGTEQLFEDYDTHVGQTVEVTGDVVKTDPITIEIEHLDEEMELEVTNTNIEADKGDKLQVYGTLRDNRSIQAENVVKIPLINYVYMYAISAVAATWISYRIVTRWRWNGEEFRVEKREKKIPLRDILGGRDG